MFTPLFSQRFDITESAPISVDKLCSICFPSSYFQQTICLSEYKLSLIPINKLNSSHRSGSWKTNNSYNAREKINRKIESFRNKKKAKNSFHFQLFLLQKICFISEDNNFQTVITKLNSISFKIFTTKTKKTSKNVELKNLFISSLGGWCRKKLTSYNDCDNLSQKKEAANNHSVSQFNYILPRRAGNINLLIEWKSDDFILELIARQR